MTITLLYFAGLRERLGVDREQVVRPDGVRTAGELRAWLRGRGGVWEQALADDQPIRIAVDQDIADASTGVHDRSEVAFFPPVTGG